MKETQGHVRRATLEDLDAVLNLDQRNPVGHERPGLLNARVASGECLLFEREGQPVGYLIMSSRGFFGRDFVELLVVAAPERRSGIASRLLHEALSQSLTRETFTSTNASNAAMIALLDKYNWTFSGQLEGIDEGDPEFVFYTRTK
ncbi:MAG: GNAT family N-acetyltransferase [Acidimicrobiales bacterium]|jgi:ribosomal protein S18 acetylase RimI-like enzyme